MGQRGGEGQALRKAESVKEEKGVRFAVVLVGAHMELGECVCVRGCEAAGERWEGGGCLEWAADCAGAVEVSHAVFEVPEEMGIIRLLVRERQSAGV